MKLLKIALTAVFVQMIEGNTLKETVERAMLKNLAPLEDDYEEIVDLNESSFQSSTTVPVTSESSASSSLSETEESSNSEGTTSTASNAFRTENDTIDNSFSPESSESSELQLFLSENDGRNESQISVIDSIYLNEEEGIVLCQKTLACEEKLKWRELTCQRQRAYPNLILEPKTKLADMTVQAEIIANSGVVSTMESVTKACMKPVTSNILLQLSKLLRKMELSRKLCMLHAVTNQNLLPVRHKTICEKIVMDEVSDERKDVDVKKFNNLETRQNALDYCAAIIAPMKKQCAMLRQCCPNYLRCTELMKQTSISKKYAEKLKHIKEIQNNCEEKILATLQSLHSVLTPFT